LFFPGTEYTIRLRDKEEGRLASTSLKMPTTSDDQQNEFDDESEFNLGLKEEKEDPELPELLVFQQYKSALAPRSFRSSKNVKKSLKLSSRTWLRC
jgi:hypothetical protein